MSDNIAPQTKYDVFVSFRGEEIRRGFLSHLIGDFKSAQINTFVDYKLERGERIWPSLVEAIEGSSILLIIFSPDYASSHWCLDELVKILECRDKYGRSVIPVFYCVEPTHVRHQSGSYEDAFAEHEREYESKKVQFWRHAFNKSADLSGIESSKFRDDDELLKEIVKLVLEKLDKPLVNSEGLVGIDKKIADVESLIRKEPEKTCLVGIWGMGGLGKTTLAKKVFNKLRSEYQGSYFLANEREQSSKDGIISLKKEIFTELIGDVKIVCPNSFSNDRIRRMKVLIVLDDVNNSGHIEELLGTLDNFGSGSRILVTTRNEQVLNANKADEIYRLTEFNLDEALELFKLNAFLNQSDHQREYDELSERVVNYAKGIPLVLKVLARLLRGKNKEVWESELDKLDKMPLLEVYYIMKLSYDDLDRKEQRIFLDLACFFLRSHAHIEVGYLKYLLRDNESDHSVVGGLESLKDKALITFSEDNFVSIHDSLKEMAWEIIRQESIKDPGNHSRLWDADDIDEAFTIGKGTEAIRSISLHHLQIIKKQKLSRHIFAKMSRLRFLEILMEEKDSCIDQHDILSTNPCWPKWQCWPKLQKARIVDILAKELKILVTELRFLSWDYYPLKSLPEKFSAEKLVILKLRSSRMEKLWGGVKNLASLKEVDLSHSRMLKKLPDLSKATNLEVLLLRNCFSLRSVHPSIFSLAKLEKLELQYCDSLTILTSDSSLRSLSYLNLGSCVNLRKFSVISENMKKLRLDGTKVKTLPSLFGTQTKLQTLDVTWCSSLQTLPELPPSLDTLYARDCFSLQTLPELPPSLKTLDITRCTSLQTLPALPPSHQTLDVNACSSLQTLPELPPSLQTLDVNACSSLQTLPELPSSLQVLYAKGCSSLQTLPELPPSLQTLDVKGCSSLQTLPELPPSLDDLCVRDCSSLQALPKLPPSLETLDVTCCSSLQTLPELPVPLEFLFASGCSSLQTLPELPPSLQVIYVSGCSPPSPQALYERGYSTPSFQALYASGYSTPSLQALYASGCSLLQTLPELPPFLGFLDASGCSSLQTLPELPPFIQTLNVNACSSLQTLPELPSSLKVLYANGCSSLQTLPELPSSLQVLYVNYCSSIQTLPELPPSLQALYASGCSSLQTLPELPPSLQALYSSGCSTPSLQALYASGCSTPSLQALDASCCSTPSLQTLYVPELPPSLQTLDVTS